MKRMIIDASRDYPISDDEFARHMKGLIQDSIRRHFQKSNPECSIDVDVTQFYTYDDILCIHVDFNVEDYPVYDIEFTFEGIGPEVDAHNYTVFERFVYSDIVPELVEYIESTFEEELEGSSW